MGAAANLAWVIADHGEHVGDIVAEVVALGFAARHLSLAAIASVVSAPAVALVVGSRFHPSADMRRACAALHADPILRAVPVVLVMPAGRIPFADPELDSHELIVRPLRPGELRCRIDRAGASSPSAAALDLSRRCGVLRLDPRSRSVWIRERRVPFSAREFELLSYLASNPARVHSRAQLRRAVWDGDGSVGTRAVDVLVRRVRARLGDDLGASIRTVRNVGYAFDEPAALPARPG